MTLYPHSLDHRGARRPTINRTSTPCSRPAAAFHILLTLSVGDCHGYGIIQEVEVRTNGALRLSPGILYRTNPTSVGAGIDRGAAKAITRQERPPTALLPHTPFGTAVARAETRRLTELVRLAKYVWRAAPESS